MAFWSLSALRTILDTETDLNSPTSEELMSQIRENIEALFMLLFAHSASSTCTSDPSNDANGYFYDTVPGWTDDEHNGRTLLILDGNGKGNLYTIDDTVDASDRLDCTGDNLYADGVRSGDSYIILYDVKVNADGHDHDGVNSKSVVLASAVISQSKLKTTLGSVSVAIAGTASGTTAVLPGGEYGFRTQLKADMADLVDWTEYTYDSLPITYVSFKVTFYNNHGDQRTGYAQERYVSASGEVFWIFILRDRVTKDIKKMWQSPDHCCLGQGGKPALMPHPFPGEDLTVNEIIVINPSPEQVLEMRRATVVDDPELPDLDLLEVIARDYEIDEDSEADWPDKEVTVGLPPNWHEAWLAKEPVQTIKKKIPRHPDLTPKKLIKKKKDKQ